MKINFTFSPPFERALSSHDLSDQENILTVVEANKKIEMLDAFWHSYGKKVEESLNKITGYSLKDREIDCYINSKMSVSHPFCLKSGDDERMKDTVVHEIIHRLFKENNLTATNGAEKYRKDFLGEHILTLNHIIIHAVHLVLVKELFPDRSEAIQKKNNPHYARSWEIVNEIGAQKLVDKYLKE